MIVVILFITGCSESMQPKFEKGDHVKVDLDNRVGRVDNVDCIAIAILPEQKKSPCSYLVSFPKNTGGYTQLIIKQSNLTKVPDNKSN